jgi:hypothetical protein
MPSYEAADLEGTRVASDQRRPTPKGVAEVGLRSIGRCDSPSALADADCRHEA